MTIELTAEFSKTEAFSWISASIIFFYILSLLASHYLQKCSAYLRNHKSFWRFKNTFVSWLHAIICSALFLYNIYDTPTIFDDMINAKTKIAYITISISAGYFFYDGLDIIFSNKTINAQAIEVLLHHFIIMAIIWVPLFTYQFVAYTLCSLAIEMNTVFLHLRFMCVFFAVDKSSGKYRIVAILNIVSFVLFRILTLCWMTRWIVLNRGLLHVGWFSLGSFGLAAMMIINIFLLQRLLQADFNKDHNLRKTSKEDSQNYSDKVDNQLNEANSNHLKTN